MLLAFFGLIIAEGIRVAGQLAKYNIILAYKDRAETNTELGKVVISVLNNDLNNSQKFNSSVGECEDAQSPSSETHFIVLIKLNRVRPDQCVVQFQIRDPNRNKVVYEDHFTQDLQTPLVQGKFRYIAHQIAQKVLKATHGLTGMFMTELAAVKKIGPRSYKLVICDYDGHNEHEIVRSPNMIIDPKVSKCGQHILFRTLNKAEGQKIWMYHINMNRTQCVSDAIKRATGKDIFGRNISSSDFGLTSQHVIFARSSRQTTNIYEYDLATRQVREVTRRIRYNIQTCPIYADAHTILYSSDISGKEAIYCNGNLLDLNAGFMGSVNFSQPFVRGKKFVCSIRGREEGTGYTGILCVDDFTNPEKVANARVIMTIPRPGFLEKPRLFGDFVLCRNTSGVTRTLMWIPADAQHNEAFVLKRGGFMEADVFPR